MSTPINGTESANYHGLLGYIGMMEKMETTEVHRGYGHEEEERNMYQVDEDALAPKAHDVLHRA